MNDSFDFILSLLESIEDPIIYLNKGDGTVAASGSLLKLIGVSDLIELKQLGLDRALEEDTQELQITLPLETGESIVADFKVRHIAKDEAILRLVSAVSEERSLDLFRSQRLAALGFLAGGVAHDFNNVLTGILGHVSYLKAVLPDKGKHSESLDAIEDGAKKASAIAQQILSFSKQEVSKSPSEIDLNDLTHRTCSLLRGALPRTCKFEWQKSSDTTLVLGDEGKLSQILVNLVINARDAVGNQGEISVAVDSVESAEVKSGESEEETPVTKKYARIQVIDNGCGIEKEILDRIFEPFFSTKKDGGTGLGLSTVKSIVHSYGGLIRVNSEKGKGTTVEILIPQVQHNGEESVAEGSSRNLPRAKQGERILIIDDEFSVRNILALSLQHLGYDIVVASSGPEGLDYFAREPEIYSLVILDMLMPELSGDEVYKYLKDLKEDTKVLLISGFVPEEVVKATLEAGAKGFVQKPFALEQLAQQVRTAIDS